MNIVVLGGGGFIGSWIVDRLLARGHCIRVLERPQTLPWRRFRQQESLSWRVGDLYRPTDLEQAISGCDWIIHLADSAVPDSTRSGLDPDQLEAATCLGRLLAAGRAGGLLFLSSGGTVYGEPDYLPIDEHHATRPRCGYGRTKLEVERLLRVSAAKHGWSLRILRVANAYGPRQRTDGRQGVVARFAHQALVGQPISLVGNGAATRDFIHVRDVASACERALVCDAESTLFNIATGRGTGIRQIAERLETLTNRPLIRHPGRASDCEVSSNVLDCRKAERELGWKATISLDQGMADTLAWLAGQSKRRDR